jgi:putative hydrolase of the HAD superfamily
MTKPTTPAELIANKSVVIFDLFHTLTGKETSWSDLPHTSVMLGVTREAWNEQLLKHSRERLIGKLTDPLEIVRGMAHALDSSITEDTIRATVENRIARFAHALINIPNENVETLSQIRSQGKRLALISNADVMEIAAWGKSPLAGLFHETLFSCKVGFAKPEQAIFRLCLDRLKIAASDAVFVGDGGSDELRAARECGLSTIMVAGIIRDWTPDVIPARAEDADFVVESIPELVATQD